MGVETYEETYEEIYEAEKRRFPNAKFVVSCFNSIDEIENKILISNVDEIIYTDEYFISNNKKANDYFIIKRKPNKNAIYYCDVIDALIENNFIRNDCDHRFLEHIGEVNIINRNNNSIKIFGSFWGS